MDAPVYRLYSILAADAVKVMNGVRGSMVTQGGHGFVHALWDAMDRFPDDVRSYRAGTAFKTTLVAPDEAYLRMLRERYQPICGVSLVEESGSRADGSTTKGVKGVTCLGIGPIRLDLAGDDLRSLKAFC